MSNNNTNNKLESQLIIDGERTGVLIENPMMLRQGVGTAEAPDGTVYSMDVLLPTHQPCITNQTTKLTYYFDWNALINLAIKAGIDGDKQTQ